MGSTVEGLYTVQIKNIKELLAHGRENKKKLDENSVEIYCQKNGPFITDVVEWEIHMYPVKDVLKLYLCLLDTNTVVINKYGFIVNLLQHNCNNHWIVGANTNLGHENDFKADDFGNRWKLTMVQLCNFNKEARTKACKDDCINIKLAIWFIIDDSSWKPGQKVCPPDLITTLRGGEFADIDFVVGGKTFPAHMAVLAARSSVFKSELGPLHSKIRQNSRLCVSIEQMNDTSTFEYLLHFIYTDSLPPGIDTDRYHGLFIAAHSFKVERLRKICEKKFSKEKINTILSTLGQTGLQNGYKLKIVPIDGNKHWLGKK